MANSGTSTTDDDLRDDSVVENEEDTSSADENANDDDDSEDDDAENSNDDDADDDDSDDDSDDDDSDDDDSDDDEEDDEDEEDKSDFKKAFSNIKGETPEEYIPNLEEAYRKSSSEGKKLAREKKEAQDQLDTLRGVIAQDPELAKAVKAATEKNGDDTILVDPALLKARADYEQEIQEDLTTFMKDHPDLEDDEDLVEEFMDNVKTVGAAARKKGKVLKPLVAYKRAWAMLDRDDSEEEVVNAAKKTATKPKTTSKKKSKTPKKDGGELDPKAIALGKKMGLTEEQVRAGATSS